MTPSLSRHPDGRRPHLRLLPANEALRARASSPEPRPTAEERHVMSEVAAELRRRAGGLPERSPLRAELLETAEYYALGADPEASGDGRPRSRVS